ncbi:Na(+)/H(+) antiporter subunit C [Haematomicrobium sanguinis]|uniref:Na(+)/H(+) antiporter subunit C n=1 Tax=Haematomicrobium sanguinis TaxID=479106 RepID=UPI00068B3A8D|nr:Na(+)/H(+) antiporter subunit C [Haematomicrobium sanguinis]
MSVNLTLLVIMGAMFGFGIYLVLERGLTRVLLGLVLLTNAANILLLMTGGYAGLAPLFGEDIPPYEYNDPLPQALMLTAIVIGFGVTSFMLAIIYRSWVLARQDELQDDIEDRRVASHSTYSEEEPDQNVDDATEFDPLPAPSPDFKRGDE